MLLVFAFALVLCPITQAQVTLPPIIRKPGICTTYGVCNTPDPITNNLMDPNCRNNTPAVYPQGFSVDLCPEYADQAVCCDAGQYEQLESNIRKADPIFKRCPACLENFKRFWCAYTCSPDQSMFREVTKVGLGNAGKEVVTGNLFTLTDEFTNKFWDSCKDVVFGATGQKAVKVTMGADDPVSWLEFMGERDPEKSPEEISFNFAEEFALDRTDLLHRCDDPDPKLTCGCLDCPAVCPDGSQGGLVPDTSHPTVNFLNMLWDPENLILTSVYFGYLLILLAAVVFKPGILGVKSANVVPNEAIDVAESGPQSPRGGRRISNARPEGNVRSLSWLQQGFYYIGLFVARQPGLVIALSLVFTGICAIGISQIIVTTNPVDLWVPPNSDIYKEKLRSDEWFGPFYRTEQMIISRDINDASSFVDGDRNGVLKSILDVDVFVALRDLQNDLGATTVEYDGRTVSWEDLCNKPVLGQGCLIQSPLEYFVQQKGEKILHPDMNPADFMNALSACANNPTDAACMGRIGAPTFPYIAFGGYPEGSTNYTQATSVIISFMLDNWPVLVSPAEVWEKKFLERVQKGVPGLTFAYSTEGSIESELTRETMADVIAVFVSYILMFVYISLALGRFFPFKCPNLAINMKFGLGAAGILVVLCSLAISVGICALAGVHATLIISEVIPFLVLAIGIDNVFIIFNTFERSNPTLPYDVRLAETLASVGTSITLSSLAETFAFGLGALTGMPAVEAFAIYSAVAIFFDFLLQITLFSALLIIDAKRKAAGRMDCVPMFKLEEKEDHEDSKKYDEVPEERRVPSHSSPREGFIRSFMRKTYVPFLLHRMTKLLVLIGFPLMLFIFISYTSHDLELGLEQQTALPRDSYLQDYFEALADQLRVGPPVYYTVPGFDGVAKLATNYSLPETQNKFCGLTQCDSDSLGNIVARESLSPLVSYTQLPVASWVDDYISWSISGGLCCRTWIVDEGDHKIGDFCVPPHQGGPKDELKKCKSCLTDSQLIVNGTRPPEWAFNKYMANFLYDTECGVDCALCGTGHYPNIVYDEENQEILASRFMTFHTILANQSTFINALRESRRISGEIEDAQNIEVFAYSVFYVFFEQYLYISNVAVMNSIYAGIAIFVLCVILLRNLVASMMTVCTIAMILIDLMGVMAIWDIPLNAVSVVNLVMSIGISVEFCIHIAVMFMRTKGTRDQRTQVAMVNMGTSVVTGIFLTKFVGVIVLYFAKSQIFEIYYFRMYLAIVLLAGAHGLMFLPVMLSLIGPHPNAGICFGTAESKREEQASIEEASPLNFHSPSR